MQAGSQITRAAATIASLLGSISSADLRRRPAPGIWSRLEYACHVRDVLLVQRERVLKVRRGHGLEFQAMGRDERVLHDGYADQDPADVAVQVHHAALLFTGLLDRLGPAEWAAEMTYSYPTEATRSLRWVAVHTAHEVVHHLADIDAQR